MNLFYFYGLGVLIAGLIIWLSPKKTPEELWKENILVQRQRIKDAAQEVVTQWGEKNLVLICPHCQTEGHVHTKAVALKKGVSGAKATGVILTGGLSLLVTGLSRKEDTTQAHCMNCNSTWFF